MLRGALVDSAGLNRDQKEGRKGGKKGKSRGGGEKKKKTKGETVDHPRSISNIIFVDFDPGRGGEPEREERGGGRGGGGVNEPPSKLLPYKGEKTQEKKKKGGGRGPLTPFYLS